MHFRGSKADGVSAFLLGKPADMTLNGMFYALKFQTALGKLRDLGVVIVTAAGNDQVRVPLLCLLLEKQKKMQEGD